MKHTVFVEQWKSCFIYSISHSFCSFTPLIHFYCCVYNLVFVCCAEGSEGESGLEEPSVEDISEISTLTESSSLSLFREVPHTKRCI